jgi:hypothetical protein
MSDGATLTDTSVVVAAWQRLTARLATDESWVGTQSQRLSAVLSRTLRTSGLAAFSTALINWVRTSFLYQWLTAEPEPDVIVIDLRKTRTVGPILAVLDIALEMVTNAWQTADVGAITDATYEILREQPIRTLSLLALTALFTNSIISVVFGALDTTGLAIHLFAVGLAALGTRIRVSWEQCRESAILGYPVAVLEPPEPPSSAEPEDESER